MRVFVSSYQWSVPEEAEEEGASEKGDKAQGGDDGHVPPGAGPNGSDERYQMLEHEGFSGCLKGLFVS